MVPAYLAHLAGVSAEEIDERRSVTPSTPLRAGPSSPVRASFRHALAFVAGFSVLFVALGASVGAVGYVVRDNLPTIEKVAGALLIVMGLNLLGIIKIPWLYRTYQIDFPTAARAPEP